MKRIMLLIVAVLFLVGAGSVLANQSAVRMEAPKSAALGDKVKITLFVTHNANNFLHYTKMVILKINGQEITRWDFSAFNRPETAEFSRSFEYVMVDESATLESAAFCNIHNSANTTTATIALH